MFKFLSPTQHSMTPKTYQQFNVQFQPSKAGDQTWIIEYGTQLNPYEQGRMMIMGEGFYEDITFEGLPNGLEEEVNLGDCILTSE